MTQKDLIFTFFAKNPNMEYTPLDISKQFPTFARSSVRRILPKLLKEGKLIRETRGHYNINDEVIEKIYRKILKVGASCKGKQVLLFALTFEFNDIDREDELMQELQFNFREYDIIPANRNLDNWGKNKQYEEVGYSSEEWEEPVKINQFFPNIRTGKEN